MAARDDDDLVARAIVELVAHELGISNQFAYVRPTPAFGKKTLELVRTYEPKRFCADEPRVTLATLDRIFKEGNAKHGQFDWKRHHASEFLIKAERHRLKHVLGIRLDAESGCPHLVHSAADLLIAAELDLHGRNQEASELLNPLL